MSTTNEVLNKLHDLKLEVQDFADSLTEAKTRDAIIEDQLTKLATKLAVYADGLDWDTVSEYVAVTLEKAQSAVLRLTDALEEAGVA